MFRGFNHKNKKILICKVCKIQQSVPQHHNKDMIWMMDGSFRKIEYLKCTSCGKRTEIPIHCNLSMFYSEDNGYPDIPDFTGIDLKPGHGINKEKQRE